MPLVNGAGERGSRSSHCQNFIKRLTFFSSVKNPLLFSLCFICTIERKVSVEFLVPLLTIFVLPGFGLISHHLSLICSSLRSFC
ncbi:hypothetical protein V6N12_014270 [Hibiscus sabdariffa]|uniref:Uncharacterized protein n=1 Tax=Hibiscus sabdariffa TaxID=183260 RepID=A0ABR2DJN8_9ROSI